MQAEERLDGWRAIGAHFGRDRSTVIRWARDRGLPVQSAMGGRTRTVYARRSELDAWATREADAAAAPPATDVFRPTAAPATTRLRGRATRLVVGIVACALVGGAGLAPRPKLPRERALATPSDPRVAALYVQARDDWAQRTAPSLARAIDGLDRVTRLDPTFAPAWASLADAYVLARAYGALREEAGWPAARHAADRAVALDPSLAAARRAQGFVAYWGDDDRAAAQAAFAAALRLDPADAQTHLWYANMLVDEGQDAAAAGEYDAARQLDPGSIPIRTERAWAAWSAGREAQGAAELAAVVAEAPDFEEAHDALSVIALARGDTAGYLREMQIRARLRHEPAFSAWVDTLARAQTTGGVSAAMSALLRHARLYPDEAWPAWMASLASDRPALLDILRRADAAHETWGMVAYQRRIAARWRGDAVVTALLARRAPPPSEKTRA